MNFHDINTRIYEAEIRVLKKDIFLCVIMMTLLALSLVLIITNSSSGRLQYVCLGSDLTSIFFCLILLKNMITDYTEAKKILTFHVGMEIAESKISEKIGKQGF